MGLIGTVWYCDFGLFGLVGLFCGAIVCHSVPQNGTMGGTKHRPLFQIRFDELHRLRERDKRRHVVVALSGHAVSGDGKHCKIMMAFGSGLYPVPFAKVSSVCHNAETSTDPR